MKPKDGSWPEIPDEHLRADNLPEFNGSRLEAVGMHLRMHARRIYCELGGGRLSAAAEGARRGWRKGWREGGAT